MRELYRFGQLVEGSPCFDEGRGRRSCFRFRSLVDKSLKCIKHKGRILVVGFAGTKGMIEKIAMNRVLLKQTQILGYVSGSLYTELVS